MVYCTNSQVRVLTNLSTSDISDGDLTSVITYATIQLNHDISTEVVREKIGSIDSTRKNDIDGSNKTFYVQNWEGKCIADADDDGAVEADDISVIDVNTSVDPNTETAATVSTITPASGKFVLTTAPTSGHDLYVTYKWSYADCVTPSPLVRMACIVLTAAYAHAKINWGSAPSISFGNTRILRHMDAFDKFYSQYKKLVMQINNKMSKISTSGGIA